MTTTPPGPTLPDRHLALLPLLTRYTPWLAPGREPEPAREPGAAALAEEPAQVRALQLVLHLPRREPVPSWHAALALSASGCAALCLDERAAPGGPWFRAVEDYCAGAIRKVTRRGRGAPFAALADLPGLDLVHGDTHVRALVPGLVAELDRSVTKLQVGGTDLPVDDEPVVVRTGDPTGLPDAPLPVAPTLVVRVPTGERTPAMTAGKLMAQTGHAGMLAAGLLAASEPARLAAWRDAGCPARVERTGDADWSTWRARAADPAAAWERHGLVAVQDAGFTEIAPGTVTALASFA